MNDETRNEVTPDLTDEQQPTGDAEKGAMLGGVGGLVAGAIAGSVVGPAGAVVGAVVGGAVGAALSGAAVAAVDRIDDDSNISGFPDDMSLESVADREPIIVDRSKAPSLDNTSTGPETPIGVGMPEAITLSGPTSTSELASGEPTPSLGSEMTAADYTDPANRPIDRGGVSGDAETTGTMGTTPNRTTDGGWDQDNDANQIDVNPSGQDVSGPYAYADNPNDDRREADR